MGQAKFYAAYSVPHRLTKGLSKASSYLGVITSTLPAALGEMGDCRLKIIIDFSHASSLDSSSLEY